MFLLRLQKYDYLIEQGRKLSANPNIYLHCFQFDNLTFPSGNPYVPTTCWKDLYAAISGAERFVYITGWSVYTAIQLVRGDDDPNGASNVGELLKRKAEEGVKVLLMVWNEKLSTDNCPGLMGTHDEDTRRSIGREGGESVA